MRLSSLIVAIFTVVVSGSAIAEPMYGTAGCGLGSLVFGNQAGIVQIFAATTNGTFASQTFGISTGTSNCADTTASAPSAKAFIEANREALTKDMARGSGETLANLSTIAGCSNAAAVGATLQKAYTSIVPSTNVTDADVAAAVLSTLRSDEALACNKAG